MQGDQIADAAPRRRRAVEALAGLHGPSWCDPEWMELTGIAMPKPGDDAAAGGLGEISQMAAGILVDKLGDDIGDEDKETLTAAMSLVTPWLKAEPKRYALMGLPAGQHAFDPDRTRITVVDCADGRYRPAGQGPRLLHGDEPDPDARSEIEKDLVAQYHQALLRLRHNGLRLRHLLARLSPRRCRLRFSPVSASRSRHPPSAVTMMPTMLRRDAGRSASWKRSS